ncbi:MAG: T9SS type A sorting domain-containing protein [Prevotellaceae bacterium]|jgi:hypothetical protein|nr:T9SS type A sorting domain-containing protein [Prevotellaceae bacterium]
MKILKTLLILTIISLININNVNAQELLIGLQENHLVKKIAEKRSTQMQLQSLILRELPFIDDFSKNTGFIPDQTKWQGTSVYINNSYGRHDTIFQVNNSECQNFDKLSNHTIGVATFDAINSKGVLHDVGYIYSSPADTLLSQPINLVYPYDSIYLTFYFQAGGYGDLPENRDSLILQFSPDGNSWRTAWKAFPSLTDSAMTEVYYRNGGTETYLRRLKNMDDMPKYFFKAHVKVDRMEYLTNSFHFRFINHASISINQFTPGRASNADHWNLDFVHLDKGRTAFDTLIKDVAITIPMQPFTNVYEEIPWSHYNSEARAQLFGTEMQIGITYSNLGWGNRNVARHFEITPLFGNGEYLSFSGGSENIYDFETVVCNTSILDYDFYSDTDSANFEVKAYLTTDSDPARQDFRYNDTTVYYHRFYDSYAYDDGTAENGYGLFGVGSAAGKVAVQFYCFASDSLRGVYLYFNHTINDINENNKFRLTVWSDDNGVPGEILYTQNATKPTYSDSLNQFVAYKFTKPVFVGRRTNFYVGWQQTNDDFINLGFDRNRNHQDKVFYTLSNNSWETSIYEGSPMLRPIFSPASRFPENPVLPPETSSTGVVGVILSPNPSSDYIRMAWADEAENTTAKRVEIYNMRGNLVKIENSDNNIINVSNLQAGTYIVRIYDGKKLKETKKIIVSK